MQQFTPGTALPFERCENFRELGGYKGLHGRAVRHGVFYRGPALANIKTEKDIAAFKALRLCTVFDFRSTAERADLPDPAPLLEGINHYAISAITGADGTEVNFDLQSLFSGSEDNMHALFKQVHDCYAALPFHNAAYKAMFAEIQQHHTPLYFHCTAGKDRTGVAAALILLTLGVSRQDVLADYMRTNDCRPGSTGKIAEILHAHFSPEKAKAISALACGVKEESLALALDSITQKYADFDAYLLAEYNIDAPARAALCEAYLEKE